MNKQTKRLNTKTALWPTKTYQMIALGQKLFGGSHNIISMIGKCPDNAT